MARSATAALTVSIEIGTSVSRARRSITGSTRSSSTSSGTGSEPGTGRLAADVEHVGTLGDQLEPVRHRRVGVEEGATVRERVGRDVDHPHHGGCGKSLTKRQHPRSLDG